MTRAPVEVPSFLRFAPGRLRLTFGAYQADGSPAIEADDVETGEPAAVLTVCVPGGCPPGCVLVKDWSENEGALRTLVEARLVEDTGQRVPCGFTAAIVARLLPSA